MNSYRRLLKEVQECKERPIEGITLGPHADNLFEWDVVLNGPIDSPYEGLISLLICLIVEFNVFIIEF